MINKHPFNMTRRGFSAAMVGAVLSAGFKSPVFAYQHQTDQADGLLHLRADGKIVLYSGGAHAGPYGEENILKSLIDILGCGSDDIIVALGKNPAQLPGFLVQNTHHMSFTSSKTNSIAANILKAEFEKNSPANLAIARYVIEDGISANTYQMIKSLKPEGIIVAVRQCA